MNSSRHSSQDRSTGEVRTATISESKTGPVGVCIFVATAELHALGIDLEETDTIEYRVDPTVERLIVYARGSERKE